MKHCRDIHALYAFSRLRASEFAKLTGYLEECRDEALGALKKARVMDDVARLQSEVETLETILQYVRDGESLAQKYQTK